VLEALENRLLGGTVGGFGEYLKEDEGVKQGAAGLNCVFEGAFGGGGVLFNIDISLYKFSKLREREVLLLTVSESPRIHSLTELRELQP
jgi:phage shock protein PspC (stress-responsive transcriptional regulator)